MCVLVLSKSIEKYFQTTPTTATTIKTVLHPYVVVYNCVVVVIYFIFFLYIITIVIEGNTTRKMKMKRRKNKGVYVATKGDPEDGKGLNILNLYVPYVTIGSIDET